ncbi:MAG: ABC transporter permease [Christensenellales bacterium]|jgi:inositol transport system permease protein
MNNVKTLNKKRNISFADLYSRYGIFAILLGAVIISAILSPTFMTTRNIVNILRQNVVIAVIAFGTQFIMLAGDIDLSSGSVAAFTGCMAAQVMASTGNIVLSFLTGLVCGALIGALNGVVITQLRIPAFIMTLASQTIFRGLMYIFTNAKPITGLAESFAWMGQGHIGPIPVPIFVLVIIFVISWVLLNRTSFGRHVLAVGGNREAALASGINTDRVRIKAFIYGGLMAALGGFVLMSRINSGQPNSAVAFEFDAITAVVIGGTSMSGGLGTVYGTLAGAYFVGVLINIMTLMNVSAYYQQVVQGLIIAIAVIIDVSVRRVKRS